MSEQFATRLNNHTIFKSLADTIGRDASKCMRLITCRNDILYIWNNVDKCVDTVNIKQILKEADLTEYVSLVPSPSVFFSVENVLVNCTSTILALYGPCGIAVMKLPDRWLLKEKRVDIHSNVLAQRLFLCDHHVIRQVKWHPCSPTDSHLLMLTSDEKLRLYNVLDETMLWECSLSNHVMRRNIPNMVSIGETPVDFDFGLSETVGNSDSVRWPIFIVWGNGDVFSISTSLEEDTSRLQLQGPFRIVPSAEDNYGSDASSIVVMETSPPLVIISTCNGLLYHCLLLSEEPSKSEEVETKVLHVIERIELELGIPLGSEADEDIISCPIHLEIDPNENSRYFCIHNAGMHSVSVPFTRKLLEFNESDCVSFDPYKVPSFTEYLVCTATTSGIEISSSPILGVAYLDLTKILVLLASGKLINIPLLHQCDPTPLQLKPDNHSVETTREDLFQIYIQNLLKDNGVASCPLIKLPADNTRRQDWLEIVVKATHNFRAVLKCHSEVALKIQQKSKLMNATLSRLMESMDKLNEEKSSLRSMAEQIAEKYEEINEKQLELVKRTEKCLLKIECSHDNTLTGNEKKMANLLEKAKLKISQIDKDIAAILSFHNQLEVNSKPPEEKDIHLGNKSQMLFKNLKHLANEVTDIKKRIIVSQDTVSQCQFQDL